MLVANSLFQTFCHISYFPLLQSQTLGCSKTSKKYTSPFLAHFRRSAACRTPGAVSEEVAEKHPCTPWLFPIPCPWVRKLQGSMERETHHPAAMPLLCSATLWPFHSQFSSSQASRSMQQWRFSTESILGSIKQGSDSHPWRYTTANWRGNNLWNPEDWECLPRKHFMTLPLKGPSHSFLPPAIKQYLHDMSHGFQTFPCLIKAYTSETDLFQVSDGTQINLANFHTYLDTDKWIVLVLLISAIIFISALTHILNLSQDFLTAEYNWLRN